MRQKLSFSLSFVLIMMAIFASITTLKAQETNANFAGQVTDTKGVALIGHIKITLIITLRFGFKTSGYMFNTYYSTN